jgi:hypothetical protein
MEAIAGGGLGTIAAVFTAAAGFTAEPFALTLCVENEEGPGLDERAFREIGTPAAILEATEKGKNVILRASEEDARRISTSNNSITSCLDAFHEQLQIATLSHFFSTLFGERFLERRG